MSTFAANFARFQKPQHCHKDAARQTHDYLKISHFDTLAKHVNQMLILLCEWQLHNCRAVALRFPCNSSRTSASRRNLHGIKLGGVSAAHACPLLPMKYQPFYTEHVLYLLNDDGMLTILEFAFPLNLFILNHIGDDTRTTIVRYFTAAW